jgi:ribosome recycling factor
MAKQEFDLEDVKRRMQGAVAASKHDLSSLRTGRAAPAMLESVKVDAYGSLMPLDQLGTVTVPEPRLLVVQVWDRSMVSAVEKAIRDANLGLNPQTEGQTLRLRVPELNEQRRKELVKVAHKYAEDARVAIRHVRRDAMDLLKKLGKDGHHSEDEIARQTDQTQKATDSAIGEIDKLLAAKEKEIMQV